jgi:hypothetical protein
MNDAERIKQFAAEIRNVAKRLDESGSRYSEDFLIEYIAAILRTRFPERFGPGEKIQ